MNPAFLAAVLDTLVPGDGGSPPLPAGSAAGLDAAAYAAPHQAALRAIAEAAGGEDAFVAATGESRARSLGGVEAGPAAAAFKTLVAAVLRDYYECDPVVAALGWRNGAPQPAGHPLAPTDAATWQRLERVKRRPPLWR